MPKIVEYINKDDKLQPSSEGESAWTGAGRRIAPAFNEAATLIRESQKGIVTGGEDIASAAGLGVKGGENVARSATATATSAENIERAAGEQTAAGKAQGQAQVLQADQVEKLEKAFLSQYKDLFDIGEGGATKAARGGGGFKVAGGGRSSDDFGIMNNRFPQDYGAGNEILNGATALTSRMTKDQFKAAQFPTVPGSGRAQMYEPASQGGTPTASGSYDTQAPGGFGDSLTASQIKSQTAQGDAAFANDKPPPANWQSSNQPDAAFGWNQVGPPMASMQPTPASPDWAAMLGSMGQVGDDNAVGAAAGAT
jgi:hypothetical protein